MDQLALTSGKSFWKTPENYTAIGVCAIIAGAVLWFWGLIVPFVLTMLIDTLHTVYLVGILGTIAYLALGKRPRLFFRVILRKLTSLIVPVYPIEIIEDKLIQMKKRRDKMDNQISLVNGSIVELQRKIDQNHKDAMSGFGKAKYAESAAAKASDIDEQLKMQLAMKAQARRAQRREQSNIGYTKLLERLQKVYKFLTRYSANVNFFIEDTQDEIEQKKIEYQTTGKAFGAMQEAMRVIKGNSTEEDIYQQAFDNIEQTVSTQLGVMDDLQRISEDFMNNMDLERGSVDESALQALNSFEQKALTSGSPVFQLVSTDKSKPVPVLVPVKGNGSNDYEDLLKG